MNKGARVLLWDPDEDHKGAHYTNWRSFVQAVKAGLKSGKGFRLAWAGDVTEELFEKFCAVCWAVLDGERELHILIEELADVQKAGKAGHWFGQLCRKSRKYGGVIHWTTQRSQEISKTVFSQTDNFYIGFPSRAATPQQVAELARLVGADGGADALRKLQPLEFYSLRRGKTELKKLNYKNI